MQIRKELNKYKVWKIVLIVDCHLLKSFRLCNIIVNVNQKENEKNQVLFTVKWLKK